MAKKFLTILLCIVLISFAGCKKNANENNGDVVEPISRLALITADVELELDYDYAAVWEGIVSCSETNSLNYGFYRPDDMSAESIEKQFEFALRDGATVIICMGREFGPVVEKLQKTNPDVRFIIIDARDSISELSSNTHSIMFRQEQGSYIAGYAAVKDGFTKLAFMGNDRSDPYTSYAYGYVQGIYDAAKEASLQVEVSVNYIADYESNEAALDKCNSMYANGTEIIMLATDDSFSLSCAQAAVQSFGYTIGTDNDHSYLAAALDYNPYITSAIKGMREAVDTTLEMLLAGKWNDSLGGKTSYFGLENGNYIYLPDYEATWLFSGFSLSDYSALKDKIADGTVTVTKEFPSADNGVVTIIESAAPDTAPSVEPSAESTPAA